MLAEYIRTLKIIHSYTSQNWRKYMSNKISWSAQETVPLKKIASKLSIWRTHAITALQTKPTSTDLL